MAASPAVITCPGHSRPVVSVGFCEAADGLQLLVSACHDKTAQLRWADSGHWIGTFQGHAGACWAATLDRAGGRAATASADFSAKLWDATTGAELATFPHAHVVKAVDFSFSGSTLLTSGLEKKAFLFDVETAKQTHVFPHDNVQVPKAVWISEHVFVTGCADAFLRAWDMRAPAAAPAPASSFTFAARSKKGISDVEFIPDRNLLVACQGRSVAVFDLSSFRSLLGFDVPFDVEAASLSRDGRRIVAGGSDLWNHVYDVSPYFTGASPASNSPEQIAVLKGHHGPVFCARWDRSGGGSNRFASGSEDGTIRIWSVA